MNEIATQKMQLPDTLEDLSKFVLVGRTRLTAVRDAIKRIRNIELAAEVYEQKLSEAQDIADAVLDAEVRIGELTSKIEKATANQYTKVEIDNAVEKQTKTEKLEEIGIKQHTAERFERMAKHPDVVEQAKADARANGRIVTRQDVLNRIAPPKSQTQAMREFKQQAREEHEAFKEKVKESVVDFEDIRKDQINTQVVISETRQVFSRAFRSVTEIGFLKQKDVDEMIKSLDEADINLMKDEAATSIKILEHLINKLGGKNG